uniref:VWFA domain-containing protein n=1 Tax=Ursus americanus TaxID=9643 RepID=A0A452Q7F5_URSAM
MPILLFLIDTSASMNQRTDLGTSYLDIAKGAVELFLKPVPYLMVSSSFPPHHPAGWKENHATFMSELKNLQASGLTTLGQALRSSFDLLNLNRLISGIDNYGQGRNPFFLEPSILITITDGNKLTSTAGVQEEVRFLFFFFKVSFKWQRTCRYFWGRHTLPVKNTFDQTFPLH